MERFVVIKAEIESARDTWKQRALEAEAALKNSPLAAQLATLQAEYDQLKAKADLDHDTLVLTEESNENLAAQLKKAEELLRPILGKRSLAQMIAEANEDDATF